MGFTQMKAKVCIIGGGIVGLATAHQLLERHPGTKVLVLEKESAPGQHQTGHNSGVLHCGLYYKPGSARARMAVTGVRRMVAFCQEHGVPYDLCGKTVIATEQEEIPRLHALFERGTANGVEGLKLLGPEEVREYEPHAAGIAGIRVPQEGITDYSQVCVEMVKEIREWGGEIQFSSEAKRMERRDRWTIHTPSGDYEADFLITCAGLYSDRVGRKAGSKEPTKIVPFRGEYYLIKPDRQYLVRNLIYPVPDPKFPFLGVHFTRLIHGGAEAGPNAVLRVCPRGISQNAIFRCATPSRYSRTRDSGDFFVRYPKMCWDELKRSYSKELFCRSLQRLVPGDHAG